MAMTPKVGDQLGQYTLTALIARGGMSTVYRAHDERLDRDVALKLLSAELSEDAAFRARFEREWRIAAGLRHPNIVPVFDAGEWEDQLFIGMQLIEGPDLATVIGAAGPLAPARAVSIVTQLAAALDAAHAQGIVHRDVKPGNVLLLEGRGGAADHVYLADFGLTRRTSSMSRMTRTGSFLGTLGYIAPEQLKGLPVDARTDEYSLACVAYEMLTSAPPFPRDSEVAMITAHLQDPPPAVSLQRGDLPLAVDGVIAKGMAKEPDQRYPSCGDFARAFAAALLGDLPTSSRRHCRRLRRHCRPPCNGLSRRPIRSKAWSPHRRRARPTNARECLRPWPCSPSFFSWVSGPRACWLPSSCSPLQHADVVARAARGGVDQRRRPTVPRRHAWELSARSRCVDLRVASGCHDTWPWRDRDAVHHTGTGGRGHPESDEEPEADADHAAADTEGHAVAHSDRHASSNADSDAGSGRRRLRRRNACCADSQLASIEFCHRNTATDTAVYGFDATLQCDVNSSGVSYIRFWSYGSRSALRDEWDRRVADLALNGYPTNDGDCWNGIEGLSQHAWGDMQCDIDSHNARQVRWDDLDHLVYGVLHADTGDLASVVDWWSQNAILHGTSP